MHRKSIEKKHYSLGITFALFILIMSSIVITTLFIRGNQSNDIKEKLQEIGYGKTV